MQKTYKFGLNAVPVENTATLSDFEEIRNDAEGTDKGVQNHNPYGACYFNDPSQMALVPDGSKVTSIPSPYARMHITDIAFREMMAGTGVMLLTKTTSTTCLVTIFVLFPIASMSMK